MSPNKFTIELDDGYVRVAREADYEVFAGDMPWLLDQISVACRESGCRKVLVTGTDTQVHLSTMEVFDLGETIAEMGLRVAIVEVHDAPDEDAEFLGAVAFNRGGGVEFFETESAALKWLSQFSD